MARKMDARMVALTSSRAVVAGQITPATIVISELTGKIESITRSVIPVSRFPSGTLYKDHSPYILIPGLVDAHVHLNEPGRTEWEGFWTGTRAAASGGVTTVIDMPLNSIPPTTTLAGFDEKVAAARGKCWVDVGFYGGIVPGNAMELKPLVKRGVRGFKGFLIDSGVDEFPAVTAADIAEAMAELADEPTCLMFHAEMAPAVDLSDDMADQPPSSYQSFLSSRPPSYETRAIEEVLSLASLAPSLHLHIVHLSAIDSIPLLRAARRNGVNITAETCFHYLTLAAETVADGDTRHKCCPPIRTQFNQDGLWAELTSTDSVIPTVVSDHSPCTPSLKLLPAHLGGSSDGDVRQGDFFAAWGGVSSVGLGLSILWTERERRKFGITDVVRWCCASTARQVGLEHRKGELAVGMDADVVVFDDEAESLVEPSTMLFRNKCSPYEGKRLRGVVRETWLRGRKVFSRDDGFDEDLGPFGELLIEPRKLRSG